MKEKRETARVLHVVSWSGEAILGEREFAIEPGKVTLISGKNGTGKTTRLRALQQALGGGSLGKIARIDPDGVEAEPEMIVVIKSDDGSEHYRVERDEKKLRVRKQIGESQAFEDVPRPAEFIASIADAGGINPVFFVRADEKERVEMLLGALNVKLDRLALLQEMGLRGGIGDGEVPPARFGLNAFEEIEQVKEFVYNRRRGLNVDVRQKKDSAEQLRRKVPAILPDLSEEAVKAAGLKVEGLAGEVQRAVEAAEAKRAKAREAAKVAYETQVAADDASLREARLALRADHERAAAAIRVRAEQAIADDLAKTEEALGLLQEGADHRRSLLAAVLHKERETADVEAQAEGVAIEKTRALLAEARGEAERIHNQSNEASAVRALSDQAKDFDAQAESLEEESKRLSAALDTLERHRAKLAEAIPIPGLTIVGGMRVNGVPFDQLNKAQRVRIGAKVAILRAMDRPLRVVIVDGAENLDSEQLGVMADEFEAAGVQAIIGRVEDHELTVKALR